MSERRLPVSVWALAGRQTWRDFRAGELRLLMVAVMLAVAAMSAVGFFAGRLDAALLRDAAQLLGGDAVVASDQPAPAPFVRKAQALGLVHSENVSFPSMARAPDDRGGAVRLVAAVGVLGGFWVAFPLGAVAFGAAAAAVVPLSGRKMLLVGVAGFGFWMAVAGGVNWWAAHQADVPGRVAADLAGRVAPLLTVGAVTVAAVLVWSVAYRPRLDPLRYATAEQRAEVTRRDGYRCSYCGADGHAPGVDLQMDHRKAHSRGGKTVTKNLMWLCSACNRSKGNLPEWQGRRRAKNAARAKRRRGAFS